MASYNQYTQPCCSACCAALKPSICKGCKQLYIDLHCRKHSNGNEAPSLAMWHNTVHSMRTEVASWIAKQSKHAAVGHPFVTTLLCLEEDVSFNAYVDSQMDHLQRQLKARTL